MVLSFHSSENLKEACVCSGSDRSNRLRSLSGVLMPDGLMGGLPSRARLCSLDSLLFLDGLETNGIILRKNPKRFLAGLEDRLGAASGEMEGGFNVSSDEYS